MEQDDLEIQALQQSLADAKQRKANALELQRQKAASALQDRLAAETKKRADDLLEYQALVAKHEERRRLEQEAKDAAKRDEARKQRALEEEAERLEQVQRERAVHEAKCAALAQAARAEEVETERIEADLQRSVAPAFEPPPPMLADTPLSCIFGGRTPAAVPVMPQVEPTQLPPERRRESPEEHQQIAGYFLQYAGVRITSNQAKGMCSVWTPQTILEAVQLLAQFSSRDRFAERVEGFLWKQQTL